jgi:hypothetical protein
MLAYCGIGIGIGICISASGIWHLDMGIWHLTTIAIAIIAHHAPPLRHTATPPLLSQWEWGWGGTSHLKLRRAYIYTRIIGWILN